MSSSVQTAGDVGGGGGLPQWPCFFNTHVPFQPRSVAEAQAEMQSGEEDKQGELQDDSRDLQAESRFQPRARARSTSGGFGLGADEDGYVTNGASTTANGKRKSSQSPRGRRGKKHRRPSSPKSFWATVLGWSPQLLRQRSRQALELPSLSPTPHRFTGTRFYLSPATLTCVRTAGTRLGRVRKAQRGKPW